MNYNLPYLLMDLDTEDIKSICLKVRSDKYVSCDQEQVLFLLWSLIGGWYMHWLTFC